MPSPTVDRDLGELLVQVDLGDADRSRLVALGAQLAPHLTAIAGRLLERRRAEAPAGDTEASGRLQAPLVEWMRSGLCGPYDAAFTDQRSQMVQRLIAMGLSQHAVVMAMAVLRAEYHDRIDALYALAEAHLVARAVDKLLDVERVLLLRYYQLDDEANLVAREHRVQSDRVTAIQTLSAGLAHEIRNPLNAATLQLEVLERRLRRGQQDSQLLEPVARVNHELSRLTRMLSEFLAFANPHPLMLGTHDVVELVREAVTAERQVAGERGVLLELAGAAELPSRVDPQKLQQILHNLVHNALEAVPDGGHVTVTVTGDDDHAYLAVEDDGPGIPPAVQHRVYEPFFTTKHSGTGLGLSIVYGMVTLHGGTISIDSTAQRTRFHVTLPRHRR
jgi:two-component system sensor histidine kinase HydH